MSNDSKINPINAGKQALLSLNLYKSHKEIKAGKITNIAREESGQRFLVLGENGGARWPMTDEWFERHKPERGGYLVQYRDGYMSYSPAVAFEEGNTRISMTIQELAASVDVQRCLNGLSLFEAQNVLHHVAAVVSDLQAAMVRDTPAAFDLLDVTIKL